MTTYGLIGNPVSHSFSEDYFLEKFKKEHIDATYHAYRLDRAIEFKALFLKNKNLRGLNVTIPFKEAVVPFLDIISKEAREIGAVNTISYRNKQYIGHNTDGFGFMKSLFPLLEKHHNRALILGTGGAAKAIAHALDSLGIHHRMVSRTPSENQFSYAQLDEKIINRHHLIINCTPLGTSPNTNSSPDIPYKQLSEKHLLYDLTYNPAVTQFLAKGQMQGCKIFNGQKMLEYQAERSWEIWTED